MEIDGVTFEEMDDGSVRVTNHTDSPKMVYFETWLGGFPRCECRAMSKRYRVEPGETKKVEK